MFPLVRTTRLSIVIVLIAAIAGCSQATKPGSESFGLTPAVAEDKKIESAKVVKAFSQPAEIAAGQSGEANIRLMIQDGYHINANPPTYPYLKATALEVPPANGVSAGKISYPPALNRKFQFADEPLAVYEGQTELKVILKVDKSAQKGNTIIPAKLLVQACDEEVCYPPGTIDMQILLTVK